MPSAPTVIDVKVPTSPMASTAVAVTVVQDRVVAAGDLQVVVVSRRNS
jgi:hypothetical protein